jgi:hypothetical protein
LLPTGIDTFTVSYAGSVIGRGVMSRSRIQGSQGPQLLQVYNWRRAGGTRDEAVDSLFSDPESLRTIREVRVVTDTVIEADFRRDSVRLTLRPRLGPSRQRSVAVSPAAYSSAVIEALVAASPLSQDFAREYHVYYLPPAVHGVLRTSIRVLGSDRVRDRQGIERDSWTVSADTPGGGTTYWIDKQTRAVLKYDTREGPATIEFRR